MIRQVKEVIDAINCLLINKKKFKNESKCKKWERTVHYVDVLLIFYLRATPTAFREKKTRKNEKREVY